LTPANAEALLREAGQSLSRVFDLLAELISAAVIDAEKRRADADFQQTATANEMKINRDSKPAITALRAEALYSWKEIKPLVGVGRETWRRYVNAGTAPQPIVLGARCTRYLGSDVLKWLSSPTTYRVQKTNTENRGTT